jgi:hypothetical protein
MAKLSGVVLFAVFEREDTFNYVNPTDGKSKLLRSVKVLLPHGDGTVTRESLSIPDNYELPSLNAEQAYGFPCVATVSRKSGKLQFSLQRTLKPFPAPEMQ